MISGVARVLKSTCDGHPPISRVNPFPERVSRGLPTDREVNFFAVLEGRS